MSTILVLWANGMLWSHMTSYASWHLSHDIVALDKQECDITDKWSLEDCVVRYTPHYIINCSAYTAVDLCESEGKMDNLMINAMGVQYLAQICQNHQVRFIHISTDYVFGSNQIDGYMPYDVPHPINMYGMAKYLWEQYIVSSCVDKLYTIIRTSRLYGWWPQYHNFVNTIIGLAQAKNQLKVVNDQYGAPTSTHTLVQYIVQHIANYAGWSILHCTDSVPAWGITRYDFAQTIVWYTRHAQTCQVIPCDSSQYPLPAPRPKYSYLINSYASAQDRQRSLLTYIKTYFPDSVATQYKQISSQ